MRLFTPARGPLLALLVFSAFTRCNGMAPSELECEEAVAYLEKCCPTFHPGTGLQCVQSTGCTPQVPAITKADSDCIRSRSCSQLQSDGICAAASEPGYEDGPTITPPSGDGAIANPQPLPSICP